MGHAHSGSAAETRLERARRALSTQLRDRRSCETLGEALLLTLSHSVRIVTFGRLRLGYGATAAVLFLFTALAALPLSLVSPGLPPELKGRELLHAGVDLVLLHVWMAAVAICQLLSARYYARILCRTVADDVVGAMADWRDVQRLRQWLGRVFDPRRQLVVTLSIAAIAATLSPIVATMAGKGEWVGVGTVLACFVGWFEGMIGWYFVIVGLTLPGRLLAFRFRLFALDPASSKPISGVAEMITSALFVAGAIATLFTSGVFYFGFDDPVARIAFLVVGAWGPLVGVFLYSQLALARIVSRSKWSALDEIQRRVTALQSTIARSGKEQAAEIGALLDLHDRVRKTRTLALDVKGVLSFVNTLILPLASLAISFLAGD